LTTVDLIRQALAQKHGVDIACPMTTGIFAWIAAHAAEEALAAWTDEDRPAVAHVVFRPPPTTMLNDETGEATPNFAAMVATTGHSWPQPTPSNFPLKDW
jgi:hypothetical protein